MFKIIKTDTFTTQVHVSLPTADPAKRAEGSFNATLKHLDRDSLNELSRNLRDGRITDDDFLDRVLVGVSGLGDEDGNPLPAAEQMAWVRSTHAAATAVVVAFFREISGASEKNGLRSRGR